MTDPTPSELCQCRSCGHTVIHLDAEGGWFHVDGSKCFEDDGATTEQLRVQLATRPLVGLVEDDVWETLHPAGLLPADYAERRKPYSLDGTVTTSVNFTVTVQAATEEEAWDLARDLAEAGDVGWGDDTGSVEIHGCTEGD